MKLLSKILLRRKPVNTGVVSITRNGKLLVTNNTIPDELEAERQFDREDAFRDWLIEHQN